MYAKGSSSMQQTHFQNIYSTEESGKKRQPLAQNLNVVWKYEEEGFGKSLLHFPEPSKNVRNTIMYTRCEYNYTNERNTWRKYKKRKFIFGFLTLRIWCTSVLFPPFFCFWPFLQSLRLLLHYTKATSDTSKLSLIYLDGLWKKNTALQVAHFTTLRAKRATIIFTVRIP